MSYAISGALQQAVFAQLSGDAVLTGLVSANIFDAAPSGTPPTLYVLVGEDRASDRSSVDADAVYVDFAVDVVSDAPGFSSAKEAAAAVCDALVGASLSLSRGQLTGIRFRQARAVRGKPPESRVISMSFRAHVEDV